MNDLTAFLHPRSVALVGASSDPTRVGSLPLKFLREYGYPGTIYVVNPHHQELQGYPCFPSVAEIPDTIDLMVISVNAERVLQTIQNCRLGQVRSALVLTSGYGEMGGDGGYRQQQLIEEARQRGIRICGPNSVGMANLWDGVVPTISQAFDQKFSPGGIAFISQSGALGTAVMALAAAQGIDVGYFISSGNEADWDFVDYCEALLEDSRIRIIAGYLEGVRDGRRLAQVAFRAHTQGKALVLLKVGRSSHGAAAARSHTGALTGEDVVYQAVFDQYGIYRVFSLEQLLDVLKLLSVQSSWGTQLGIIGHSGGAGVLMTDEAERWPLSMPSTSPHLRSQLAKHLPAFAALDNPIDMTANVIFDSGVMLECFEAVLRDPAYDVAVFSVNLMWRIQDSLAQGLIALKSRNPKPFLISWIGVKESIAHQLQQSGIPTFSDPVRAIEALGRIATRPRFQPSSPQPSGSRAPCRVTWEDQALCLEGYQLPLAPYRLVHSFEEALQAANDVGFPVAMKLIADDLLHKSDGGGVFVDLVNADGLRRAWDDLSETARRYRLQGILVQRMIPEGVEVLVGGRWDRTFGAVLALGIGGIYTEILRAVDVHLAPIDLSQAHQWITSQPWSAIVMGARGQPQRDVSALSHVISNLSRLLYEKQVGSVDLNPVMVGVQGQGAWVVDWRFTGEEA